MELSKRALSVLCAIVELYIRSGEAVASRQVAQKSGLGLSSATMRNVMAELEDGGYLSRSHPSAGSVPSDRGFRHYVDNIDLSATLPAAARHELTRRVNSMRREFVEGIEWVAQLVAESTNEAGVAVRPMGDGPILEAVSLVLLDKGRVLGVIVTDDGTVEKRVLEFDRDRTREELQTLSNFLTRLLSGTSLVDVENRFDRLTGAGKMTGIDDMPADARDIVRQLFSIEENDVEVRVAGTDNLLATADFSEIGRVRSLLATLEDRSCIAKEFRRVFENGRTQVLIGEESEATASGSLGIVATLYFRDERRAGAVGVVGPRRMDYRKIVPVVKFIGDTVSEDSPSR
jgi:heat-inducible transcriptional repressor